MSRDFIADQVEYEKADPNEGTSTAYLKIPIFLWTAFFVFGLTYLSRNTQNSIWTEGDKRTVVATPSGSQLSALELGGSLYKKNCQACHQATGLGVASAFPPLVGSEWVEGDPHTLAAIITYGVSGEITVQGKTFKGVMPPFGKKLKPEEVAAVATFIRQSWGNSSPAIDPVTVEAMLEQTSDRTQPWKGEAELRNQTWK